MLFNVYGDHAIFQWLGWIAVFVALIVTNEIARRSKAGGIFMFVVLPLAMTIYCIAIAIGVANGQEWAINNPTNIYQNSWFHYAKVYAALTSLHLASRLGLPPKVPLRLPAGTMCLTASPDS